MNRIRRMISYLLLMVVVMGGMWMAGTVYPKYASRLLGFGAFLLTDIFLWKVFASYAAGKGKYLTPILRLMYWLPVFILVVFIACSMLWPPDDWTDFFRIYFSGLLVPVFLWKFLVVVFLLMALLFSIPFRAFQKKIQDGTKPALIHPYLSYLVTAGLSIGTALSLLFFSGFVFWVYDFQVKRVEIFIEDLPASFDGYRIVQLSDIHLGSWYSPRPLEKAAQLVNQQSPDLLAFTGDLVNYQTKEAYPFKEILMRLKAVDGVFAILGNHDYGDYMRWKSEAEHQKNNKDLQAFYQDLGWVSLNNTHRYIVKGNDSILIAGVENWSKNALWGQRGDLMKALEQSGKKGTIILLSHDPSHWRAEVLEKYSEIDLTLSGHTHAMQMGWETEYGRWSPAKWIYSEWAGLYESESVEGKQYLYVNRGLGTVGFPARVGIRPEITVLVLRKKKL